MLILSTAFLGWIHTAGPPFYSDKNQSVIYASEEVNMCLKLFISLNESTHFTHYALFTFLRHCPRPTEQQLDHTVSKAHLQRTSYCNVNAHHNSNRTAKQIVITWWLLSHEGLENHVEKFGWQPQVMLNTSPTRSTNSLKRHSNDFYVLLLTACYRDVTFIA